MPECWWCGSTAETGLIRDMDGWVCADTGTCYPIGREARHWPGSVTPDRST